MKREDVIKELIEYDLNSIMETGVEGCLKNILECGCIGYKDMEDKELEETYNDIFDDEDSEPIKIEE